MMFIGRRTEFRLLEDEYRREDSSLVIVHGMRGVGKTLLVRMFTEGKEAFYFSAREEPMSMGARRFSDAVSLVSAKDVPDEKWEESFSDLLSYSKPGSVIVLDNFQFTAMNCPEISSSISKIWKNLTKDKDLMLIICITDSSVSSTYDFSGIFLQCTACMGLAPLRFMDIVDGFPDFSFKNSMELYSVTGGMPGYIGMLTDDTLIRSLRKHVLDRNGALHNMPEFILRSEVREISYYMAILSSISEGKEVIGEIAGSIGVQSKTLSPYLCLLESMGIIERELPFTDAGKDRSRRGRYKIINGFIEFWFRFVYMNLDVLDIEDTDKVKTGLKAGFADFISDRYRDVCMEILENLGPRLKIDMAHTGGYWGSKGNVDIVAVDDKGAPTLVADCIYSKEPVSTTALEDLISKCDTIPELKDKDVKYVLFSRSGFEDDIMTGIQGRDVILINKMKVVADSRKA